jgi:hypothetical protein
MNEIPQKSDMPVPYRDNGVSHVPIRYPSPFPPLFTFPLFAPFVPFIPFTFTHFTYPQHLLMLHFRYINSSNHSIDSDLEVCKYTVCRFRPGPDQS